MVDGGSEKGSGGILNHEGPSVDLSYFSDVLGLDLTVASIFFHSSSARRPAIGLVKSITKSSTATRRIHR